MTRMRYVCSYIDDVVYPPRTVQLLGQTQGLLQWDCKINFILSSVFLKYFSESIFYLKTALYENLHYSRTQCSQSILKYLRLLCRNCSWNWLSKFVWKLGFWMPTNDDRAIFIRDYFLRSVRYRIFNSSNSWQMWRVKRSLKDCSQKHFYTSFWSFFQSRITALLAEEVGPLY